MGCRICGNKESRLIYEKVPGYNIDRTFELRQCASCKTVYTYPMLTTEETADYYNHQSIAFNGAGSQDLIEDYKKKKQSYWKKLGYENRLAEILKYHPGAKAVLDIGCGAGIFLDLCQSRGMKSYGIELSQWGYDMGTKELGLKIFNTKLDQLKEGNIPKVDVITMYDVLEHSDDPVRDLRLARDLLNDNGLLIINLPNFDSMISKMTEQHWNKLIPPNHTFHFSQKSLASLIEKSGLEAISITTNSGESEELVRESMLAVFWQLGKVIPVFKEAYESRHLPMQGTRNPVKASVKIIRKYASKLGFIGSALRPAINLVRQGEGIHLIAKK